jgi:hypothetical protein
MGHKFENSYLSYENDLIEEHESEVKNATPDEVCGDD